MTRPVVSWLHGFVGMIEAAFGSASGLAAMPINP
nr:MAG TPA: hypothetical protein [Caudoviricetes sp.]DAL13179.1 MAG TPA_asm: hypothetical protein [Caudoviricetes sp.]